MISKSLLVSVFATAFGVSGVDAGSWQPHVQKRSDGAQSPNSGIGLNWDARIKYGVASDAPDLTRAFAAGDESGWSEAVFVTVQRRFPGSGITPYIGLGAGYAQGLVTSRSEVAQDALAFKGLFGTELRLEEGLGAFVEYGFAVAPGAVSGTQKSLRSHTLSTGIKLDLN